MAPKQKISASDILGVGGGKEPLLSDKPAELLVIGAGPGRTSTLSLKQALETLLGGKCYHMKEVLAQGCFQDWTDVAHGKPDWDKIFNGFNATTDWPACQYFEELMVKYPSAKVILSVRSADSWYKSASDTILGPGSPAYFKLLWIIPPLKKFQIMWAALFPKFWLGKPVAPITDKQAFIEAYEAWNEHVKRTVPANKLLIHQASEGWEPICKFLGKPVPDEPYPHVNDTAAMKAEFFKIRMAGRVMHIILLAVIAAGVYWCMR